MIEETPELICAKGHVIPSNRKIIHGKNGRIEVHPEVDGQGKFRKTALIACEQCAIEASAGIKIREKRQPMARPDKLRELGQSDIFSVPTIAIRSDGK